MTVRFAEIDKIHQFSDSLAFSRSQRGAIWWERAYRLAFHNFQQMGGPAGNGWCEKAAVDRLIFLSSGKVIKSQEKVRKEAYKDILLEYKTGGRPGWIADDSDADYLAYGILPTGECWLFPFPLLRRAWKKTGPLWVQEARAEVRNNVLYRDRKYKFVRTTSEREGRRWITESLAVPRIYVLEAIKEAIFVQSEPFQVEENKSPPF